MKKPKIFISHSSKTPEAKSYRDDVFYALKHHENGQKFEVFLDCEEIRSGDEWHDKILKNLCACDIVIILLSKAALKSPWVKQEAAFSAMRRYGDPSLKLIVINIDDIGVEEVQSCPFLGGVARLHDIQFYPKDKTPSEIIDEFTEFTVTEHSVLGNVLLKISQTLRDIHPDVLEKAIRDLSVNEVAKLNWNTHAAQTLALSVASEERKALENLLVLLKAIEHIPRSREIANILLKMLKYLWVDPLAAENLSKAQQQRIPSIINGFNDDNFTAESFADRTWGKNNHHIVIVGSCRTSSQIEEIMSESINHKTVSRNPANTRLQKTTKPILLVFDALDFDSREYLQEDLLPDESLLSKVMDKFKTTSVFIPTGQGLTEPESRPYLRPLQPLLDLEDEEIQRHIYLEVKEFIEKEMS